MVFLEQVENDFQRSIEEINISMMESITTFLESFQESDYITEKSEDTLMVKIKKFFADLIASFQNFKNSIKIEINKKLRDSTFKNKLRLLYDEAKKKDEAGIRKIEVMDIQAYCDEYLNAVDELETYAKRFANMKYKHLSDIDRDINDFNDIAEDYENSLNKIAQKKVKMSPKKLMKYIENEISGRSQVLDTLNDAMTLFEQMKNDCTLLESRKNILGPDIIAKKIGFIRKMSTKISSFIKRNVVRFISTIVLIVG